MTIASGADFGWGRVGSNTYQASLPLPPGSLRVIVRNLLSNAVSAGAHHVHVAAVHAPRASRLLLDDDGVGLAAVDQYETGSGLGLSLSRRIAARFSPDAMRQETVTAEKCDDDTPPGSRKPRAALVDKGIERRHGSSKRAHPRVPSARRVVIS